MPQEYHPDHDMDARRARGLEIDARVRAAVETQRHLGVPEEDFVSFVEAVFRRLSPADRARVIARVSREGAH